jgi:hypothetical protein
MNQSEVPSDFARVTVRQSAKVLKTRQFNASQHAASTEPLA